ncbi:MAG TPA: di-heme oxidoredictase family protein, partial [Candidatus Baltobacteraceae bacterium]|nr:di-heme oxidoredictase family protein [Candidatus Baltobacteraceae bacterium]
VAQQSTTEAPAGFTTPTLGQAIGATGELTVNPGSQSVSNGIAEPPGDTFALDQAQFERRHDPSTGLGPVFNATACVECHNNGVAGAASQFTEQRVGHSDGNGNFVNPTITINEGANTITGRSIVNDRSICTQAQEHVPDTENIRTLRAVLNTLGDGFVEAVDDQTFMAIAASQPGQSNGMIHGEAIQVPILEAPGQTGVGKFGWKDQDPTILSFSGDAYLNEMGVTNRLKPKDVTSVCKVTTDPEDTPDALGLADIDHFAQFIRGTQVPPRDLALAATADAIAGQNLFTSVGCVTCHVANMTTAPPGTLINGGSYTVPLALGNKVFHPYGDFLLHDVGTGDGIVQAGPADTANKLRTVPLWGLRIKSRFMHDNGSITLGDAIQRHAGEAQGVIASFTALTAAQQQQLITFLKSL